MEPVLRAENIHVSFGKIQALRGVDFEVFPGEVVGLVGDNGAGKSTLIKVLSGALQPDEGRMFLEGREVSFHSPAEARVMGIETAYQDLALAPHLNVAANLYLGHEILRKDFWGRLGFLDERMMRENTAEALSRLRITIKSIGQTVETLSGGQRQSVAVARSVTWGKKLVIMDEPTAALGVEESSMVLKLIADVKTMNIPVILISHTLPHVFASVDRIVVLRLGERVATAYTNETNLDEVVSWITGSSTQRAS